MGPELGTTSKKKKEPYGYLVEDGFMGWVNWAHRYMLFCTEAEYIEYINQ